MRILEMFLLSLALTLVIETAVALIMDVRMPGLKVVWLVNLLTNPAAVCVNWLLGMWFPVAPLAVSEAPLMTNLLIIARQLPIEVLVVLVEAGIYISFSKEKRWGIRRPVALAVAANLVSYCGGLLLMGHG